MSSSQLAENYAKAALSAGQQSQQAMSLFTRAVIHGGQFSISVSSPRSKSTIFSKEVQTIKSIRF